MKSVLAVLLGCLSINCLYGQNQKIMIKAKMPLLKGYYEYQEPPTGIYISQPEEIRLFSGCDSVFSTASGKVISTFESPKDTVKKLIIRSGNLRIFYFDLKQLNVKEGDKVVAGQFIGLAKKYADKTFSIIFLVGDNKVISWRHRKQEIYLNRLR